MNSFGFSGEMNSIPSVEFLDNVVKFLDFPLENVGDVITATDDCDVEFEGTLEDLKVYSATNTPCKADCWSVVQNSSPASVLESYRSCSSDEMKHCSSNIVHRPAESSCSLNLNQQLATPTRLPISSASDEGPLLNSSESFPKVTNSAKSLPKVIPNPKLKGGKVKHKKLKKLSRLFDAKEVNSLQRPVATMGKIAKSNAFQNLSASKNCSHCETTKTPASVTVSSRTDFVLEMPKATLVTTKGGEASAMSYPPESLPVTSSMLPDPNGVTKVGRYSLRQRVGSGMKEKENSSQNSAASKTCSHCETTKARKVPRTGKKPKSSEVIPIPSRSSAPMKCSHCESTKTPQWRTGPMGPKTLCNPCGVQYRSGRLLPEYRPAASPTFDGSLHSNSRTGKKAKSSEVIPIPSRSSAPSEVIPIPSRSSAPMKCSHCESTTTPQWRIGPMGPKTLCNACGVRYRSGRLLPEYRPAASPTFDGSLHSNSHRKVMERKRKEG